MNKQDTGIAEGVGTMKMHKKTCVAFMFSDRPDAWTAMSLIETKRTTATAIMDADTIVIEDTNKDFAGLAAAAFISRGFDFEVVASDV